MERKNEGLFKQFHANVYQVKIKAVCQIAKKCLLWAFSCHYRMPTCANKHCFLF